MEKLLVDSGGGVPRAPDQSVIGCFVPLPVRMVSALPLLGTALVVSAVIVDNGIVSAPDGTSLGDPAAPVYVPRMVWALPI